MSRPDFFPDGAEPFQDAAAFQKTLRQIEDDRSRIITGFFQSTAAGNAEMRVQQYEYNLPLTLQAPPSELTVKEVPAEAVGDTEAAKNAFREFIAPLLADAELVERATMFIGGKDTPVVAVRPLPDLVLGSDDLVGAIVAKANEEWNWFGREEYALNGQRTREGKREDADDASERVRRYWEEGRTGEKFTGKNRNQPWSAAFISYVMAKGGMGSLFRYSSAHRDYVHAAIKARRAEKRDTSYWAYELVEQPVELGDLICAGRVTEDWPGPVTWQDAVAGRGYPSHCDLVVAKNGDEIETIGGNVGQSVSKKHYRLVGGKLTESNFAKGFALLKNVIRTARVVIPSSPATAGAIERITQIAAQSAILNYRWKDRDRASSGYIKGMALVFARVYCRLKKGEEVAVAMAKADSGHTRKDALAWYKDIFRAEGMENSASGADTLRHLFVLLIGLGMRESSGRYCEGRDRAAHNVSAETAEAGLFQTSYDARSANLLLSRLFEQYSVNPSGFVEVFRENMRRPCTAKDFETFGSGNGEKFQRLSKECPAFGAEFAALALRHTGGGPAPHGHWGPIRKREAEVRPECDAMLQQVQDAVDASNLDAV